MHCRLHWRVLTSCRLAAGGCHHNWPQSYRRILCGSTGTLWQLPKTNTNWHGYRQRRGERRWTLFKEKWRWWPSSEKEVFTLGASTANQRIESWWGVMRKEGIEPWITLLGEVKDEGFVNGDFVHKALSLLCFMPIIQVSSRHSFRVGLTKLLETEIYFLGID